MTDPNSKLVLIERREADSGTHIAILSLNNPSRRNAYSPAMKEELIDALTGLSADLNCRAIVLTGSAGAFCSGADIKSSMGPASTIDSRRRMERSATLIRMMVAGPKPLVAAMEGVAIGAGLSLATACDYVVAASNTRISTAFVKMGLQPDNGGLWLLQRRVGLAKAAELATLGAEIDGTEAARIGLVNQVVEPGKALDSALEIARRYAAMPPVAIAAIKSALAKSATGLDACLQTEVDVLPLLMQTKDHKEAVAAFIEKRKPVYTGA